MNTEAPKLVTLELNRLTVWLAFDLLSGVVRGAGWMPGRVFSQIRKMLGILRPVAAERDKDVMLVADLHAEHGPDGRPKVEDNTFVWKAGEEESAKDKVREINEEIVTIQIQPLLWADLVPDDKDIANPGNLLALEEWGLVVDDLPEGVA